MKENKLWAWIIFVLGALYFLVPLLQDHLSWV